MPRLKEWGKLLHTSWILRHPWFERYTVIGRLIYLHCDFLVGEGMRMKLQNLFQCVVLKFITWGRFDKTPQSLKKIDSFFRIFHTCYWPTSRNHDIPFDPSWLSFLDFFLLPCHVHVVYSYLKSTQGSLCF